MIAFQGFPKSQDNRPVINAIASLELLETEGKIAVEHNPRFWQAAVIPKLEIYQQKSYGNTSLTFYRYE